MTLVVGFQMQRRLCDRSDTEITYGAVNFQRPKVLVYDGDRTRFDPKIGGAGHTSFVEMAAQDIRDRVKALADPTVNEIKAEVREVVLDIYRRMQLWNPKDPNRPSISLIIGIRDSKGKGKSSRLIKRLSVKLTNGGVSGADRRLACIWPKSCTWTGYPPQSQST